MLLLLTALLLTGTANQVSPVDIEALPSLSPGIEGELLIVDGRVLDAEGKPVPGAEIYAYHADAAGKYHDDAYRGTVFTDREGYYRFRTVRPGGYGPPPHIHFRVTAAGRPALQPTLHFDRGAAPLRKIQVGDREAAAYTFDISWDAAGGSPAGRAPTR